MSVITVTADQISPLVISFSIPVYQGQTIEMDFQLFDKDPASGGVVQDLTTTRWVFHLALKAAAHLPIMTKDTDDASFPVDTGTNTAQLRISAAETHALALGAYVFEIWLELAGVRRFIFATGILKLVQAIAEPA